MKTKEFIFKVIRGLFILLFFFILFSLYSLRDYAEYKYDEFVHTSCVYGIAFEEGGGRRVSRKKIDWIFERCGSASKPSSIPEFWDNMAGLPD